MTKICCVCQRVEHGKYWKDNYKFAANERVTHGYCPLCFDVVLSDLMDCMGDNDQEGQEGEDSKIKEDSSTSPTGWQNSVCA